MLKFRLQIFQSFFFLDIPILILPQRIINFSKRCISEDYVSEDKQNNNNNRIFKYTYFPGKQAPR